MIDSHAWIQSLKVGDEVVVAGHWRDHVIATVSRTTATQVIVGNSDQRFRKTDGRMIGETGYGMTRIQQATESKKKAIKDNQDRLHFKTISQQSGFTIQQIRAAIAALESQPADRSSPE